MNKPKKMEGKPNLKFSLDILEGYQIKQKRSTFNVEKARTICEVKSTCERKLISDRNHKIILQYHINNQQHY